MKGFGSTGIFVTKIGNINVESKDLGFEKPMVITVNIHSISVPVQNPVKASAIIDYGTSTQFIDRDFV